MREETNEPKKANGAYRYTLDKVWKDEEFINLLQQVRGKVGTHSLRKFPPTWASEYGATTDPEIEIRGRWKGSKNGQIVNRYISVELTTDAKVAGLLLLVGLSNMSQRQDRMLQGHFLLIRYVLT
jgi:hypothetical protein